MIAKHGIVHSAGAEKSIKNDSISYALTNDHHEFHVEVLSLRINKYNTRRGVIKGRACVN